MRHSAFRNSESRQKFLTLLQGSRAPIARICYKHLGRVRRIKRRYRFSRLREQASARYRDDRYPLRVHS